MTNFVTIVLFRVPTNSNSNPKGKERLYNDRRKINT